MIKTSRFLLAAAMALLPTVALAQIDQVLGQVGKAAQAAAAAQATANAAVNNTGTNIPSVQTFRANLNPVGDGINVYDYGAVQDCEKGYPQVTWTNNSNILTAVTQTATWSITAGSTTVSFSSSTYANTYFSPDDIGKPFAVAGVTWNGGSATTTIKQWINGTTIVTSTAPDQSLSTSANAIWPAFLPSMVGKVARVEWAAQEKNITFPTFNLAAPMLATIQSVQSPFQFTIYSSSYTFVSGGYVAGDTASINFTSSGINSGAQVPVSYTLVSGDNFVTVAQGLAANINANTTLSSAGIFATATYGRVLIQWPGTLPTLTLGRTNGTGVNLSSLGTVVQNGFGGANVPAPSAWPTAVWIGTDNTAAISAAAVAAVNNPGVQQGAYYLNFPNKRNGFAYCAFGMAPVYANTEGPGANNSRELNEMVILQGDDGVDDGFTDAGGQQYPVHIVPRNGPAVPPPAPTVSGLRFKRLADTNTPVISAWGASKCNFMGGGAQAIETSTTYLIANALEKSNPQKSFYPAVDTCIGGQPAQTMDPNGTQIPAGISKWPEWYLSHTTRWGTYAQSVTVPQYGVGAKTPDWLYLGMLGTNDSTTISDQSVNSVINYVKTWSADAFGNAPDIVMATVDQYPVIGSPDSLNNMRGVFLHDANGIEYSAGLVKGEAIANGVNYLDFGTATHLAMMGWSPQYLPLGRVPDMPAISVAAGTNYNLRYYTHDFAFDLVLGASGINGTTFWNGGATHVYIQISRRADNILDISTNSAGYLQVQENVQGGTCTVPVTNSNSNGSLSVGTTGQSSVTATDTLNEYGIVGGQASYMSSNNTSLASAGQFIVIPGANNVDIDSGAWRALVLDHNGGNYLLDGGAPNNLGSGSVTTTIGGCPFMADDVGEDIIVPGAGASGVDFTSRISSVSSQTGITMRDTPSTAQSAVSQSLWIGRIGMPLQNTAGNANGHTFVSNVQAATDSGSQPQLFVTVQDQQMVIAYERAADVNAQPPMQEIYRGPIVRFGGPFYGRIWLGGSSGNQTIQATNIRVDRPTLFHRQWTSRQLFGSQADSTDTWLANGEFSELGVTMIWKQVIEAQNWAAPSVPPVSSAVLSSGSTATAYCGETLAVEDTTSPNITLPASCPSWAPVTVVDTGHNAGTHPITMTAPSGTFLNGTAGGSATITVAGQHAVITSDGGVNEVVSIN